MRINIADDLKAEIRALPKNDRKAIGIVLDAVLAAWGKPHLHSGIGIRRIEKAIYECRVDLDRRLAFVFVVTPPELFFFFLGNHTEIQQLIRSLR